MITHELIHRLLTDNTSNHYLTDFRIEWERLYGKNHLQDTLIHIPVHAIMQAIFDDYLHEPDRTRRDKEMC